MGGRTAQRDTRTRGCRCSCAGTRATGAAWAWSPTPLQLWHSQVLNGRGQTLYAEQAAGVAEFQAGHLVDERTEGGASIFQVVRAMAGGVAGRSGGGGGLNLSRGCVRRLGCRLGGGRDLGVHGQAVKKLIDGCYWLISEAVVFGTVKHTLLSLCSLPSLHQPTRTACLVHKRAGRRGWAVLITLSCNIAATVGSKRLFSNHRPPDCNFLYWGYSGGCVELLLLLLLLSPKSNLLSVKSRAAIQSVREKIYRHNPWKQHWSRGRGGKDGKVSKRLPVLWCSF